MALVEARPQYRHQGKGQEQAGKGQDDVHDPHDDGVKRATDKAGDQADHHLVVSLSIARSNCWPTLMPMHGAGIRAWCKRQPPSPAPGRRYRSSVLAGCGSPEALKAARHVIVTSPGTAEDLADYSVDPGRISIVLPGLDPAPPAEGSAGPDLLLQGNWGQTDDRRRFAANCPITQDRGFGAR